MERLLITLVFILSSFIACSQYTIQGKIMDKNNNPLEFVMITIKKDSTLLNSISTDSIGAYRISNLTRETFTIQYAYLGYDKKEITILLNKDTTINVQLVNSINQLQEVVIEGKTPTIERRPDRIIFNPSTLISTSGDNAYETIKKAPLVYADESGNVSIKGLSGAGVMVNGKLLLFSEEQVMNYLKSISSDDILKIEVITNPSSKYDAEGLSGLLNIVLKKNKKLGLNGNANASYEQTSYARYGLNADLNYRSEKLHFFGGVSFRDGKYYSIEDINNTYRRDTSPYYYIENGKRLRNQTSSFNKLGMDYEINKNNTLGLRIEHSYSSKRGNQQNDIIFRKGPDNIDSAYHTNIFLDNYYNDLSTNLNYTAILDTAGQTLSVDLDYTNYYQPKLLTTTNTERLDQSSENLNQNIRFKNQAEQRINIYSAKADYSKQLTSSIWLEAGTKFYTLSSGNILEFYNYSSDRYSLDESKSNNFKYKESNVAFYSNLYKQFNEKWSMQAGVRNETTNLSGKSSNGSSDVIRTYNRFFPSLFLQYNKNDDNQITLNFTQRISRPSYSNLNPFRYYTNPNNYIEGNPYLQPAITQSFELSYTLNQKFILNTFLYLTKGQITQVPILNSTDNTYKYQSINLDRSYNSGINAYLPFDIRTWWRNSISITLALNGVNSIINSEAYSRKNFNVQFITNNQFTLSEKRKFWGELNFMYQPPGTTQGLFVLGQALDFSLGLKKAFNKYSLSLNVTDIFNSAYITAKVDRPDQYSFINGNYNKRGVRLTFSYKFGKSTVAKSKDKKSGIEDERQRIK